MAKEYALYQGENILCIGTLEEIAAKQELKIKSLKYYLTPAYHRKIEKRKKGFKGNVRVLICLDD